MSDPLPFKGRSVSVTAVLLQDADTAQIDVALSEKIAQVPPDFFTTQPLVADLSALEGFKPDAKWLKTLKRIFERHKLGLVGVCGAPVEHSALVAAGLAEVTISADKSRISSEETRDYTVPTMSSATGMALSAQETPQTVSVVTQQQMRDQNLTTLAKTLESTPGVSVRKFDRGRNTFSARGFAIDKYQVDGMNVN